MIDFHPREENVVDDALSRKPITALRSLNAHLSLARDGAILAKLQVRPNLLQQIQDGQKVDENLIAIAGKISEEKETDHEVKADGYLYYKGRVCVPDNGYSSVQKEVSYRILTDK